MVGKNKKPGTKKPWNTTKFIHDKKCEVPRWEQKLDRLLLYGFFCFFCTDSSLLLSSVLSKLTLEEKNLCFVLFDYFSWYIGRKIDWVFLSFLGGGFCLSWSQLKHTWKRHTGGHPYLHLPTYFSSPIHLHVPQDEPFNQHLMLILVGVFSTTNIIISTWLHTISTISISTFPFQRAYQGIFPMASTFSSLLHLLLLLSLAVCSCNARPIGVIKKENQLGRSEVCNVFLPFCFAKFIFLLLDI